MMVVSNVYLEGARFDYDHVSSQDMLPPVLPPFLIKSFTIKEGLFVFRDHTRKSPVTLHISLEDYHCEALHSRRLLFDAIFGSQATGQVAESSYAAVYQEEGGLCASQWSINDLPLKVVTPFADGKLDLIKDSSMDLLVTNQWGVDDDTVTMTCQVLLSDLMNVRMPEFMPVSTKVLADAFNILVNYQVKELPLSFKFHVKKDDLTGLLGIDTSAILIAFSEALVQAIMDKSLKQTNNLLDMGKLGLDTLIDIKNLFDKY